MWVCLFNDVVVKFLILLVLRAGRGSHYLVSFVWKNVLVFLLSIGSIVLSSGLIPLVLHVIALWLCVHLLRSHVSNLWGHGLVLVAIHPSRILVHIIKVVISKIVSVWISDNLIVLRLAILIPPIKFLILESLEKLFLLLHPFSFSPQFHLSLGLLCSRSILCHPFHLELQRYIPCLRFKVRSLWSVICLLFDNTYCVKLWSLLASSWTGISRPSWPWPALPAIGELLASTCWTHSLPCKTPIRRKGVLNLSWLSRGVELWSSPHSRELLWRVLLNHRVMILILYSWTIFIRLLILAKGCVERSGEALNRLVVPFTYVIHLQVGCFRLSYLRPFWRLGNSHLHFVLLWWVLPLRRPFGRLSPHGLRSLLLRLPCLKLIFESVLLLWRPLDL